MFYWISITTNIPAGVLLLIITFFFVNLNCCTDFKLLKHAEEFQHSPSSPSFEQAFEVQAPIISNAPSPQQTI